MKAAVVALTCALLISQGFAQAPGSSPPSQGAPSSPPTSSPPTPSPTTPAPTTTPPTSSPTTARGPASSSSSSGSSSSSSASTPTDADILYFAYNLEVFEAQFYSCAAFGTPINSSLLGGGPGPSSCTRANLTSNVATYAAELAREETAHVALLQSALRAAGVTVIAPLVNIDTAFTAAATAANSNLSSFSAYANDIFFLHASFLFEDLGVGAYFGALNSISNSSYRLVGAQIGGAEAYHSSLVRTLLYQVIDTTPVPGLTIRQITNAIVSTLNTLAGQPQLKYNIYNEQGSAISNVDSNGLVPAASAQQVLKTVTLGAAAGSGGGFFPNNLNGNVKN